MYKCIIIDDDQNSINHLEQYIAEFPKLNIVATYTDPVIALTAISNAEPVDIILLDIDMPKIKGIELAKEIRSKTKKLVFTTGHVEYSYDAIKIQADDYLLKPFSIGEFMISINRIFPEQHKNDIQDFFFVKNKDDNHRMVNIRFEDVVAVESKMNYIMIHTTKGKVLTYMSLNEISKIFKDRPEFIKFHRSYIISHRHINFFEGNNIKMNNGVEFHVGDYYQKSFKDFVQKYVLKAVRK